MLTKYNSHKKNAFLLGLLVILIHGCAPKNVVSSSSLNLQEAYQRAVADMASAEPHEIYKGLTALTPSNADLIWQGAPGDSRLLTVTWTDYQGYDDQIGQTVQRGNQEK